MNLISLNTRDRGKFLREKLDIELTRLRVRLQASYRALRQLGRAESRHDYPHLRTRQSNDPAGFTYVPSPYSRPGPKIRPKGTSMAVTDQHYARAQAIPDVLTIYYVN